MKKFLAFLIAVLMIIALVPTVTLADGVAVTGGDSGTTVYNTSVYIAPSIEVTSTNDISGASIAITGLPADCTIGYSSMAAGIMVTIRDDKKVINLTGSASAADYQQALRGIYVNTGMTSANVTFDIAIGYENTLYNRLNQHFYEFVPSEGTGWIAARDAAAAKSLYGMQGYLATITSAEENHFVYSFCGGRAWLGGSDAVVEDEWCWVTGPEAGTKFWQATGAGQGSVEPGMYENWLSGEPNEYPPDGEDYLHIFGYDVSTDPSWLGQWNDFNKNNTDVQGYVIEWGGMSGDALVDASETCYLTITSSLHKVSFNSHGGSAVDSISNAPYGGAISEPSCTLAGYDLVGWFKTDAYNTQWNFNSDTISGDMTLHAKWTPRNDISYNVEHYQQDVDGEGYTPVVTECFMGTTDTTVNAVAKTYTGFTENTTHPQRIASGTVVADSVLMLKLYYDRDKYAVSFNSHGGSSVDPMSDVLYGSIINKPSCTLPGYDLVGWFKTDAYNTQWNFMGDTVSGDMTLHAKWTVCTDTPYIVEHYKQDVQGDGYTLADTDNMTGTTDETVTAVAKTYAGCTENITHAQRIASGTITGDGSLVLKLYYDREEHTVTFDKNTTDTVTGLPSSETMRYGGKITEPNDPVREDFAFIGWYKESECTNLWSFGTDTVQADTTLYAKWSQARFMVTYDSNGGSGTASGKQYEGATFTLHSGEGFSKDDFVIEGWDIDGTKYELGALYTMPASHVTAKAIWAADGDNDGISDDDETAAGTDPGDDDNSPDFGTVKITVLGSDGKAKAGLTCVLNSQPVTAVTDENGVAVFKDVALAPHTLSVRSSGTQLGTYSIDFSKGSENGTTISDSGSTDSIGGVTATVTSTFLTLDLTIKQSSDGQWTIDDSSHTEQVPNPTTGTSGFAWLWVCAAALLAAGGILAIKHTAMQK